MMNINSRQAPEKNHSCIPSLLFDVLHGFRIISREFYDLTHQIRASFHPLHPTFLIETFLNVHVSVNVLGGILYKYFGIV